MKRFQNCIIKINDNEYKNRISDASGLIVTYGGDMVTYNNREYKPPKVEAFDACGCGDTFFSSISILLFANKPHTRINKICNESCSCYSKTSWSVCSHIGGNTK